MKVALGLLLCVALATGAVVDEFAAFKAKFNKVYSDEREVSVILASSLQKYVPYRIAQTHNGCFIHIDLR